MRGWSLQNPAPTLHGQHCNITGMLLVQLLVELWMSGDDTWIICPSVTRDQQTHWSYCLGQHHCTAPGWGICIILYSLWLWSFPQINLFRLGLKHPPNTCCSCTHKSFPELVCFFFFPSSFSFAITAWLTPTVCPLPEERSEDAVKHPMLNWHLSHWHCSLRKAIYCGCA